MKYPADIFNDDGWGRIHQGHGIDRDELQRDLERHVGLQRVGETLKVQEVYFRWIPRIKWCGNLGWPCDNEGEWHGHWEEVLPNPTAAMTVVHWPQLERAGYRSLSDRKANP